VDQSRRKLTVEELEKLQADGTGDWAIEFLAFMQSSPTDEELQAKIEDLRKRYPNDVPPPPFPHDTP
jgi:hypothetical protein